MTQQEMADFLHVKLRTYQNYESQSPRLVRVPFRLIDQIAEITETRSEWLLHGTQAERDPHRLDHIEEMLEAIVSALGLEIVSPAQQAAEAAEAAAQASATPQDSSSRKRRATRKKAGG